MQAVSESTLPGLPRWCCDQNVYMHNALSQCICHWMSMVSHMLASMDNAIAPLVIVHPVYNSARKLRHLTTRASRPVLTPCRYRAKTCSRPSMQLLNQANEARHAHHFTENSTVTSTVTGNSPLPGSLSLAVWGGSLILAPELPPSGSPLLLAISQYCVVRNFSGFVTFQYGASNVSQYNYAGFPLPIRRGGAYHQVNYRSYVATQICMVACIQGSAENQYSY